MNSILAKFCLAAVPLLAASTLLAQPVDAVGPAPAPFRSALDGYRPFSNEKQIPWKEANETVQQVGGWRAYAKEAATAPPEKAEPANSIPEKAEPANSIPEKAEPANSILQPKAKQ